MWFAKRILFSQNRPAKYKNLIGLVIMHLILTLIKLSFGTFFFFFNKELLSATQLSVSVF